MNIGLLLGHEYDETTILLRTDFSDDAAWDRVKQLVTAPADFGIEPDDEAPDDDGLYTPNIQALDDAGFDVATSESLTLASDGRALGYLLLADAQTMREAADGGEVSVVYVDLSVSATDAAEFGIELGRAFRCLTGEVASIEVNLSISNMDFEDFANSVDTDGVFRGFPVS